MTYLERAQEELDKLLAKIGPWTEREDRKVSELCRVLGV
jgi:hypothetical protein